MSKDRFIIAVSGGVDSCYLLHTLVEQGGGGVVCHVNHGLREEADEDARFVQGLAAQYGLAYEEKKIDLSGVTGFEARAREERLKFYSEVAQKHGLNRVALAHHADDQAETILMQLCRGSQDLPGIREVSAMPEYGIELWRPLLKLRKVEIVSWMEARSYPWREDHTNQEAIVVRNRVRHEVIPLLNEVFSRDVTPIINRSRSVDHSAQVSALINALQVTDPQGRLFLPKVESLPENLQTRVLKEYLESNGIGQLSTEKLAEAAMLISRPEVWKVNLSEGKFLRRKEKRIFIE